MRDVTTDIFNYQDLEGLSNSELASLNLRCEDFSTTCPRLGECRTNHRNKIFIACSNLDLIKMVLDVRSRNVSASDQAFADKIGELQTKIHDGNVQAGWWSEILTLKNSPPAGIPQEFIDSFIMNAVAAKISLMHSELSEALEGWRKGLNDDHLPHRSMIEVEFADAIIRILDTAEFLGLDVGGAIMEKLAYNKKRADHKPENRAQDGGKKI